MMTTKVVEVKDVVLVILSGRLTQHQMLCFNQEFYDHVVGYRINNDSTEFFILKSWAEVIQLWLEAETGKKVIIK